MRKQGRASMMASCPETVYRLGLAAAIIFAAHPPAAARADTRVELVSRSVSPPLTAGGESTLNQDAGGQPCCSVSGDGRYVVFVSDASNLVPGQADANDARDVFLRDLNLGTTTLVSHSTGSPLRAGNGESFYPTVSADGRYVAFQSAATDLTRERSRPRDPMCFSSIA